MVEETMGFCGLLTCSVFEHEGIGERERELKTISLLGTINVNFLFTLCNKARTLSSFLLRLASLALRLLSRLQDSQNLFHA